MPALQRPWSIAASLILTLILAACGGGGGGSNSSSSPSSDETFDLSGQFMAPAGTAMDTDVNDPNAPLGDNSEAALAQPIFNPITVGGYVNLPGEGEPGRSLLSGDVVDYYRVTLSAGQVISLSMAGDGETDDLDLYLNDTNGAQVFDGDGNPIRSIGKTPFESMTVAEDGTYLIAVVPFAGAANYVMVVGQTTLASQSTPTPPAQFAPGETLVRFVPQPATYGNIASLASRAASTGLLPLGGGAGREVLMSIGDAARCAAVFETLGIGHLLWTTEVPGAAPEVQLKLATELVAKALQRRPDVGAAAPNYLRHALFEPNDELFPRQWHYPLINLPQAWDNTPEEGNVIVAVIDTGVVLDHPDLKGQLTDGYDFISDPDSAGDGDGIDPDPDDPGDGSSPGTSSFHGTHVAGTVAAATNNGIGVAGVAFNAKVMPLRVLGRLGGTDADLIQAIRFAAGLDNDSGTLPERRADIINMSLGGGDFSQVLQDTITEARNRGVIIVAAAGNTASPQPFYPAAMDGVVSVSALTINKTLAPYSSFGSTIDVAAPGGFLLLDVDGDGFPDGVLGTGATDSTPNEDDNDSEDNPPAVEEKTITPTYLYLQGTSMASPHMAGVAALMKSVYPDLRPQDLDNLLAGTTITEDLGTPGWDVEYGHGMINAFEAVIAAINLSGGIPPGDDPVLVVTPGALNFGLITYQSKLSAVNGGGGDLKLESVTDDAPWLEVRERNVDGDTKLGEYDVLLDRHGLSEGTYTATITFVSDANTVHVPFIMQVPANGGIPPESEGNAGLNYVVLVDAESEETVQSFPVELRDGAYTYHFPKVPKGRYKLFAGTDSDNDGLICDAGEACGVYPPGSSAQPIDVDKDLSKLDFIVKFSLGASRSALQAVAGSGVGLAKTAVAAAAAPKQVGAD